MTPESQRPLALYMLCQMTRVENWRTIGGKLYPDEWKSEVARWCEELSAWGREDLMPEFRRAAAEWEGEIPPEANKVVFRPWLAALPLDHANIARLDSATRYLRTYMTRFVDRLLTMKWQALHSRHVDLITCDNPVGFTGKGGSEVVWTLSPTRALRLSRNVNAFSPAERDLQPRFAKRINRGLRERADRFVYAREPTEWIAGRCSTRRTQ